MAEVATIYNALPSLVDADEGFNERAATFQIMADLLAQYKHSFGLCLVHPHCQLTEGEIMLANGNHSQPESAKEVPAFYPERWLSSGAPYEFTLRPTVGPSRELVKELRRILEERNLQDILGLYHIDRQDESLPVIEWTEGRMNLTRTSTNDDKEHNPIETGWDFGLGNPVTMACVISCDARTTRSGTSHKGMYNSVEELLIQQS